MKVKRIILRELVGCFVIFAMSATASAATAHIEGPAELTADPGVTVPVEFQIFIDTTSVLDVDWYDYSLGVSGPGVVFDAMATEAATDAFAVMPSYIFSNDSDGMSASNDFGGGPTTIYASDQSAIGNGYNPTGKSLGKIIINVTGGVGDGHHIIAGRGNSDTTGFDVGLLGATGEEGANIRDFEFSVIIPEPATLSMLALGGLALIRRRRSCGGRA